jgi:hypothetical protein
MHKKHETETREGKPPGRPRRSARIIFKWILEYSKL